MKRLTVKLVTFVLLAVLALSSFAGCGDRGLGDCVAEVTIGYNEAGYGNDYLKYWAQKYNEAHPDEKIKFDFDNAVGSISSRLQNNSEIKDIFISLATNWQSWARSGWLEPLDDLYAMTNEDGNVFGETFRGGFENYGKINNVRYVMPQSGAGSGGFVYSKKLFDTYGWEVPHTITDLYALVDKINALPCNTDKNPNNDLAPFAWGGQVIGYWNWFIYAIWGQVEGEEKLNEFWQAESPEIYKDMPGLQRGLEIFRELICTGEGVPKNSLDGAMSKNHIFSQNDFVQGKAAMLINIGGVYNETKKTIPDDFDMRMFPYPYVEDAKKDENGDYININVATDFDFICIPKTAKNKEYAKKFLCFISTNEAAQIYTKYTGGPSPFVYDMTHIEGLDGFIQSIMEASQNVRCVMAISENPLVEAGKINVFPSTGVPYGDMIQKNLKVSTILTTNYNYAVANWNNWKADIGL